MDAASAADPILAYRALLEAGEIHPVIGRRVPFEEVPQALEDLEQRRTTGRSVVVF